MKSFLLALILFLMGSFLFFLMRVSLMMAQANVVQAQANMLQASANAAGQVTTVFLVVVGLAAGAGIGFAAAVFGMLRRRHAVQKQAHSGRWLPGPNARWMRNPDVDGRSSLQTHPGTYIYRLPSHAVAIEGDAEEVIQAEREDIFEGWGFE